MEPPARSHSSRHHHEGAVPIGAARWNPAQSVSHEHAARTYPPAREVSPDEIGRLGPPVQVPLLS